MGNFTREIQKETFRKYYQKYYPLIVKKYLSFIDAYIQKHYPRGDNEETGAREKISSNRGVQEASPLCGLQGVSSLSKLISVRDRSGTSRGNGSQIFHRFLRDVVYRRVLIYELRGYIHKKIHDRDRLMSCLKSKNEISKAYFLSSGKYGKVYRLEGNEQGDRGDRCVKIVNISENELYSLPTIQFHREIEISKRAGELGVGPRIHETYVCVNEEDSSCYGIIYMDLLRGRTYHEWMQRKERTEDEKKVVRKLLEEKMGILHQNGIIHNDIHDDNVYMLLNENDQIIDVKIIDYGFANYIQNYVTYRNRKLLEYDLFQDPRKFMYRKLSDKILAKIM